MVDLFEILSTHDSFSKPDISSRPYLDIEVGDATFYSLVDTGSSKTFLGLLNVALISSGECKVDRGRSSIVLITNENNEIVIGTASLPITFCGVARVMTVVILPELNDSCELDTDFITIFDLVIGGQIRQQWLSDKPIIKFAIDSKFIDNLDACRGIAVGYRYREALT